MAGVFSIKVWKARIMQDSCALHQPSFQIWLHDFIRELEYQEYPPGVDQHNQSAHPHEQTLFSARLLIAYTQILDSSLDLFS
jgi:hypothetical protein